MIASNNLVPILDVHLASRLGATQAKALSPLNRESDELTVFVRDREHSLAFLGFDDIPNGFSVQLASLLLLAYRAYKTDPLLNDLLAIGTQLLFPLRAFGAHESITCAALGLLLACLDLDCARGTESGLCLSHYIIYFNII
jgi:hypothetical protein